MDTGGILGAYPVKLETIDHHQSQFGEIVGNIRLQRFDPGVELLFWQFLREYIDARLPQSLTRVVGIGGYGAMAHAHISERGKLWIDGADRRIQSTLSKNYPQKHGHFNRRQGFLG